MQPQAGQVFQLLDAQEQLLGQVRVERTEADLVLGNFVPGPGFPAVQSVFLAFEKAANSQALAVVDELDAAIAALGLHLRSPDSPQRFDIHDVQIWSDGGITFRIDDLDAGLPRRVADIESGRVVGKPAEQVFAELREKYPDNPTHKE
jgi:hypothetical protein